LGNGLANSASGPPSYNELGADGSSVSVTPSDYSGATTAGNAANVGGNMNYTEATGTPGYGVDVNPGQYGQENLGTGVTGADPTFWDNLNSVYNQVSGYINGPIGKTAQSIYGPSNPNLQATASGAAAGGDGGGGWGQGISALASLYKGYAANKQVQKTKDELNNQLNGALSSYAPGSAYGTELRKTLEAKDAASGRRSQYGSREVQLAALLADKQNSVRQAYMGQAPTILAANQQIAGNKNAQVADLFNLYGKNYKQINGAVGSGLSSLYNYFNPPSPAFNFDAGSVPLSNQG
jgi:hypothetical protein